MTTTSSSVLIILTDRDRAELESLARARKAPLRSAQRACIILATAGGHYNARSPGRSASMSTPTATLVHRPVHLSWLNQIRRQGVRLRRRRQWPNAVAKIIDDVDALLAFYDLPAEHWIHLRTTDPIESTFAAVRLRQRATKGPGSRAAGVAMRANSSSPPKPAGAPSTHPTSSP